MEPSKHSHGGKDLFRERLDAIIAPKSPLEAYRGNSMVVDTLGLMLSAVVHPASPRDRDGAVPALDERTRRLLPFLERSSPTAPMGGPKLRRAIAGAAWKIEVVKRPANQKEFEVLPKRWVVEHTIAWINRCRRLAKVLRRLTGYCVPLERDELRWSR